MDISTLPTAQQAVMRYILDFTMEHERTPTVSDIAAHRGVSVANVSYTLNVLQKKGFIERTKWRSGSITISKDTRFVENPLRKEAPAAKKRACNHVTVDPLVVPLAKEYSKVEVLQLIQKQIQEFSTEDLLNILAIRGGHPGALAHAALLCIKKSRDYNVGSEFLDASLIDRSDYFPFGRASYVHMIWTKAKRLQQVTERLLHDPMDGPSYDTLIEMGWDLINYAGFFVEAESTAAGYHLASASKKNDGDS